tara:strand:+ start:173 stop:865 length:693 start_codon:yes stop_codon:yes gene_type:complete
MDDPMKNVSPTHPALVEGHAIYQKNVYDPADYPFDIIKRSTNKKLGKKVTKGRHAGLPIYTLTLEERKTCTKDCEHWDDCYGNNMPFAHRFMHGKALEDRIREDLDRLDSKHRRGYLLRLHILGDFYSPRYVAFWEEQLSARPGLNIYGYTRTHPGTPIGDAVAALVDKEMHRFSVRFSMLPDHPFSANGEDYADPETSIICPVQTDKTDSCSTCGLCWTVNKPITFLTH